MIRYGFSEKKIRMSIVDGIFYPADKTKLTEFIDEELTKTMGEKGKSPVIIVPHAAYQYAGSYLAEAFNSMSERKLKNIVILSTVHREKENKIFLPESGIFQTPLGEVTVDMEKINLIASCSNTMKIYDIPHLEEHSIEVSLPFIQHLFPDVSIVPILLGDNRSSLVKALSSALKIVFQKDFDSTAFIVSCNFSQMLPFERASLSAETMNDQLNAPSWEPLIDLWSQKQTTTCSCGAIASIKAAFPQLQYSIIKKSKKSTEDIVFYEAIKGE